MDDSQEIFELYREVLFRSLQKGYLHFLFSVRTVFYIKHSESYKLNPIFWGYTWYSHSESASSSLVKILEKRKDCKDLITIHTFLNTTSTHINNIYQDIDSTHIIKMIDEHRAYLESLNPTIEKLMYFRDRLMSHLDRRFFKNLSGKTKALEIGDREAENIFISLAKILHFYSYSFDGMPINLNISQQKYNVDQEFHPFEL